MNLKNILLLSSLSFVFSQLVSAQEKSNFLFTKGDNNISTITMGAITSTMCNIIEYPDYLILIDIPHIPKLEERLNLESSTNNTNNRLISFIDSIYLGKPIKYILNTHSHTHSLSTIVPFLEIGAQLVTTKENLDVFSNRGLFGVKTIEAYSESIVSIDSDTILLANTKNPIEVVYLKKSDYKSIPTETYLFFNFPNHKLLAAGCMVDLGTINKKYGYKGILYTDRLIDADKIIIEKNLTVENTLQLFGLKFENGARKPAVYSMSHFKNVLKYSWHRKDLIEHFTKMSYEELTTEKDSILNYLSENNIYHNILNFTVYSLIEKQEYQKAAAMAGIYLIYAPGNLNVIDTAGEAYFNNGQIVMAKHFNEILKRYGTRAKGLGLEMWETNLENRLKKGS